MSNTTLSEDDFEEEVLPPPPPLTHIQYQYLQMVDRTIRSFQEEPDYKLFLFTQNIYKQRVSLGLIFEDDFHPSTGMESQMQKLNKEGLNPIIESGVQFRAQGIIKTVQDAIQKRLNSVENPKELEKIDIEKNVEFLASALQLSDIRKTLLLYFSCAGAGGFNNILSVLYPDTRFGQEPEYQHYIDALSYILRLNKKEVEKELDEDNILMGIRFLTKGETPSSPHYLEETFKKTLKKQFGSEEELLYTLIGDPAQTELTAEDFEYPGSEFDDMCKKLETFLNNPEISSKIMALSGPPGTGKTERMAVVEQRLNVPIFMTGNTGKSNETGYSRKEPTREERTSALIRSAYILRQTGIRGILVFDEAEDILRDLNGKDTKESGSKAFTNDFLENLGVPVVFISNRTDLFDPATIRRIMPIYHVNYMPFSARKRAVAKKLHNHLSIKLGETELHELAKHSEHLTIAVIDRCITSISGDVADQSDAEILKALNIELRRAMIAMSGGFIPLPYRDDTLPESFSPDLISASQNIPDLAKAFSASTAIDKSSMAGLDILIVGASGTGRKTAAKYLCTAFSMEAKILHFNEDGAFRTPGIVHAGDLERAALDGHILILHGIKKFFEIAHGHPLIERIRNHPYPTFLIADLQQSEKELPETFARDITITLRTGPLSPEQIQIAAEEIRNTTIKNRHLPDLDRLTIGDIYTAKRKLHALGKTGDRARTLQELLSISSIREPVGENSFGFGT